MGKVGGVALVVVFAALLAGCAPAELPEPTVPPGAAEATLVSVIDGDTIESSVGTVRIIGIDAPEGDECGYAEAAAQVSALLSPGAAITLTLPDGENDTDRHGRLLRYVDTADGVDVGMSVLTAGLAVARYDSIDGYPAHPREAQYRAGQTATLTADGAVTTVACQAAADAARGHLDPDPAPTG